MRKNIQEAPPIARPARTEPPVTSPKFSRRTFLGGAAGTLALGAALATDTSRVTLAAPQEAADAAPGTTERIRRVAETKYTVDQLGYRVTNAWKASDGFNMLGYQGVLLQEDPTSGDVRLWNTLDEMNKAGLDTQLDNGSLEVTIPPYQQVDDKSGGDLEVAFKNRVAIFGVPADVVGFANSYRRSGLEVGVFTSPGKSYGDYEVWRMQRIAVQRWKDGRIQRILAGDAAKKAGIVPQAAQLAEADLKFGDFSGAAPAPVEAPKPTAAFPPHPGGNVFETNPAEREKVLSRMGWEYINIPEGVSLAGKHISTKKDGDRIIITVATNKSNPNETKEVVLEPKLMNGVQFVDIALKPYYQSSDPDITFQAVNHYVRSGDPINVIRMSEADSGPLAAQHILTYR